MISPIRGTRKNAVRYHNPIPNPKLAGISHKENDGLLLFLASIITPFIHFTVKKSAKRGSPQTDCPFLWESVCYSVTSGALSVLTTSPSSIFLPRILGSCIPARLNTSSSGGTDFIIPEIKFAVEVFPSPF